MHILFKVVFILLTSCCIFHHSYALNWDASNSAKNCNNDPITNSSGQKRIPSINNLSASSVGNIPCNLHGYYGGSWTGWRLKGGNAGGNHFTCPDNRYASQISCRNGASGPIVPCSENGTGWTHYRIYCKYRDDTPPNVSDITNSNPIHILANDTYNYNLSIDVNGGSPIDSVRYQYERYNTPNLLSAPVTDSFAPGWGFSWNISRVDNNRVDGAREYTYRITEICDAAGNCWNGSRNFYHNVYANTTRMAGGSSREGVVLNPYTSSVDADGVERNILVGLTDEYGNDIVPASGISRTIDLNVSFNNNLRLDQYRNDSTDSAIFLDGSVVPIGINTIAISNNPNASDNYVVPIQVYAPTANEYNLVPGNALISGITYDVNGTLGVVNDQAISSSNFDFNTRPKYRNQFVGGVADVGFIEGAFQSTDVDIDIQGGFSSTSSESLRLEFGDVNTSTSNNVENLRYGLFVTGYGNLEEGEQTSWSNTTDIGTITDKTLNSLMTQDGSVANQTTSYLASIIKYRVGPSGDRRNVIYPADIIGKDSYHGSVGNNNSYQEGLKIIGNTSSTSTGEIVVDQYIDDVRVLGDISKSSLRRDIDKKVFSVIRQIDSAPSSGDVDDFSGNTWDNSNDGEIISGGKVLYFKGDGSSRVNIASTNNSGYRTHVGQKTIVVIDADVYINDDIQNNSVDDILGIIVLGGDILINNEITDLDAVLYTNKSIFSSTDGINRLDGSVSAFELANQLYIRGSVFSENTIGGSRKSTPECPYYINTSCNQSEAQAYDFNFLRRYYRYDSNDDGLLDADSGATSPRTSDTNPIVIEYNPAIQQTPPPFFD